jgi:CTP:molybdopterin cytidylyltransferase MocA
VIVNWAYLRDKIADVQGDRGLRDILRAVSPEDIDYVPWPDRSVTVDIDTVSDMKALKNEMVKNEN